MWVCCGVHYVFPACPLRVTNTRSTTVIAVVLTPCTGVLCFKCARVAFAPLCLRPPRRRP